MEESCILTYKKPQKLRLLKSNIPPSQVKSTLLLSIIDLTLMCTMSKLNLVQSIILRLMLLLCTKLGLIIKSVTCTK